MVHMTNTYVLAGEEDPDEIIAQTPTGVYVEQLGGGQVDAATGDFVFGTTEAYLIEGGQITENCGTPTSLATGPRCCAASTPSPPTSRWRPVRAARTVRALPSAAARRLLSHHPASRSAAQREHRHRHRRASRSPPRSSSRPVPAKASRSTSPAGPTPRSTPTRARSSRSPWRTRPVSASASSSMPTAPTEAIGGACRFRLGRLPRSRRH